MTPLTRTAGLPDSHAVPTTATTCDWGAVVPVKRLAVAKSRLSVYGDPVRAELALAFACDVVTACLLCEAVARVVVVTDDPRATVVLQGLGARVVPDARGGGLNPALSRGAEVVRAVLPGCNVVAVTADLPSLRPDELGAALAAAPIGGRAFVADSDGIGTTLLTAAAGVALDPAFGPGSRVRHLGSGAVELNAGQALRQDVDTPDDLGSALLLGVGRHTARALAYLV